VGVGNWKFCFNFSVPSSKISPVAITIASRFKRLQFLTSFETLILAGKRITYREGHLRKLPALWLKKAPQERKVSNYFQTFHKSILPG